MCGLKAISCAGVLSLGIIIRNKFSVKVEKIISRIKVSRFDHIF